MFHNNSPLKIYVKLYIYYSLIIIFFQFKRLLKNKKFRISAVYMNVRYLYTSFNDCALNKSKFCIIAEIYFFDFLLQCFKFYSLPNMIDQYIGNIIRKCCKYFKPYKIDLQLFLFI